MIRRLIEFLRIAWFVVLFLLMALMLTFALPLMLWIYGLMAFAFLKVALETFIESPGMIVLFAIVCIGLAIKLSLENRSTDHVRKGRPVIDNTKNRKSGPPQPTRKPPPTKRPTLPRR